MSGNPASGPEIGQHGEHAPIVCRIAVQAELREDRADDRFDGLDAQVQFLADGGVGSTAGAVALGKLGHRWAAALLLGAAITWPVAHIGNVPPLAVAVNIALVVVFGSVAWPGQTTASASYLP